MDTGSLKVRDLSFSYGNEGERLFENLDLTVSAGSHILVLAPPDSGKSTLAHILCALIPKYRSGIVGGTVELAGKDVGSCEPWDLTHLCTLVAQDPQDQLLMTTCEDEIAFPLESLGLDHAVIATRIGSALRSWGLHHVAGANPQELSGGERKRLLLAVAEAIAAPVWILDEPFDDLDSSWRERLIGRIASSDRTVLVFASRYIDEFHGTFDRYALLSHGRLKVGSEEETVLEFERVCDQAFPAVEVEFTESTRHVLECHDVEATHQRASVSDGPPFLLQVADCRLESEEIVALVGPNGSGKSTFSRTVCGLDAVQKGTFKYDGKEVGRKDLNRIVGYVFQNPDYELFMGTVRDELAWSLRGCTRTSSEKEQLVVRCADLFHLDVDATVATMGYGMRKHLQAAIHYLLDRPFYILDELDSGVTYSAAFEMVGLLRSRGAGILLITHDRSFAESLASRTYVMDQGVLAGGKER